MQIVENENENESIIEELNSFFSNISYNYYDVPMAMILAYYKKKFKPLTQNEIYLDIISNKNYKEKLRKSTGGVYTKIQAAIQKTISSDSIFKEVKDERNGSPKYESKYSIDLNKIKIYWNEQALLMKRNYIIKSIEKNNLKKNSFKQKDSSEIDIIMEDFNLEDNSIINSNDTIENIINKKKYQDEINNYAGFLHKKTKRKFLKDNKKHKNIKKRISTSFNNKSKSKNKLIVNNNIYESNISNISDIDISIEQNDNINITTQQQQEQQTQNKIKNKDNKYCKDIDIDINSEELSELLDNQNLSKTYSNDNCVNNKKSKVDNENILSNIFSNSIYDIWPLLNEDNLNKIVDEISNLDKKLNFIKNKLQDLMSIQMRYYTQLAEDEKINSEKEKEKIFKVYENIKQRINQQNSIKSLKEQILNELTFNNEKKWLKDNTNNYLLIYDETYNNLSQIVEDRNKIFNHISEVKIDLIKDMNNCEKNLTNFITYNISKINKTKDFLKKYNRNYYEYQMEKAIEKINEMFLIEKNKKNKEENQKKDNNNNTNNINKMIGNDNVNNVNNKIIDFKQYEITKERYLEMKRNIKINNYSFGKIKKKNNKSTKKIKKDKQNKNNINPNQINAKDITNENYKKKKLYSIKSTKKLIDERFKSSNKNIKNKIDKNIYNNSVTTLIKNNINIYSDIIRKKPNQTINIDDYSSHVSSPGSEHKSLLKIPLFINKDEKKAQEKEEELNKDNKSNNSQKTLSLNNFSVSTVAGLDLSKIKEAIIEDSESRKIDFEDAILKNNGNHSNSSTNSDIVKKN